ncbi:hypothetical protein KSS87_020444 [Heliosperma pusillum]|nr:hypothetical protein KSS87_020444 [Heliosperma pusillum]
MDSVFANVFQAPEDPILGVTVAYNKDPSPVKLNLGVGAYRTEEGKPLVLNVVRKAEQKLVNDPSRVKEYLPILGLADFNKLTAKLILGADSPAILENRVATAQCLSGTGSLRVGAEFLARHYHQRTIYITVPTWGNHTKIFNLGGLNVKSYRYYDPATRGLDFQGLLEDLNAADAGAVVLFHACAHNPTGVDPTLEQWEQIRQLVRSKGLLPFFDSAYQGFASGNLDADAQSVRMFVADGGECFIAQSYAKNMGLYGERVGALSIVCKTAEIASKVESQVKLVIRPMYSNPPIHGASIVASILKDRDLYDEWTAELKEMADRIISMRKELFDALTTKESAHASGDLKLLKHVYMLRRQVKLSLKIMGALDICGHFVLITPPREKLGGKGAFMGEYVFSMVGVEFKEVREFFLLVDDGGVGFSGSWLIVLGLVFSWLVVVGGGSTWRTRGADSEGTPGDWSHIIKQIGMFTFTGLNVEQVKFMTTEYHIYMTSDGRISMAGLSSRTVPHLADAIHAATTQLA